MRLSRRDFARVVLAGGTLALAPDQARADGGVPVRIQADLLVKVAAYDDRLVARPGERRVLLFTTSDQVESESLAKRMRAELAAFERIAGKPHREELMEFRDSESLAETCRQRDAAIVYLSAGLGGSIRSIAAALEGIHVLTVAALPDYVKDGAVLGFDLVSGKPKLLIHLAQARRQRVAFKPELLRLAKVYR